MRQRWLIMVLCWAAMVISTYMARAAPLPKDITRDELKKSILHNPATYDPSRSTWRAELIRIPVGVARNQAGSFFRYFRKEIELAEEPVKAALVLLGARVYKFYINGQLVRDYPTVIPSDWAGNDFPDLTRFFHKGRNVIALESPCPLNYDNRLLMEGMVRVKSGRIVRITSDQTWRGGAESEVGAPAKAGWERPDYDDSAWARVAALGKPDSYVGYGLEGYGGMLNPPYYGPIELQTPEKRKHFIYDFGKPLKIPVKVYPYAADSAYDIRWRLNEADTEKEIRSGDLGKGQVPDRAFKGEIAASIPAAGVYELFVELVSEGKVVESRVEELAVVGKIPQREVEGKTYTEGMNLELTDEIDCADPNSPYQIFSQTADGKDTPAPIVETAAGKYREAGGGQFNWFGFAVRLEQVYQPYLIEAEVPDDADRVIAVKTIPLDGAAMRLGPLSDGTGFRGFSSGNGGITTGIDQPLTGRMIPFRIVVFLKSPILGIQVMTMQPGFKAAVGKVWIYRITNDLPALKVASPDYRLTGQHLERMTLLPLNYYAGPDQLKFVSNCCVTHRGFYKDWYNLGSNMIKYLRFAGENMMIPGIYMYYPENGPHWNNRETANSIELLARMCAANGIKLMLGVEYSRPPLNKVLQVTDQQVAEGASTDRLVDKNGRQAASWAQSVNFLVPEVREDLKGVIADLVRLYQDTPGIGGIALMQGLGLLPDLSYSSVTSLKEPLACGYDDLTVGLFEKETKIKVPADPKDPKRFQVRYDWLMANAKDQWVAWRNRKVYEINRELAQIMVKGNPDWKLAAIALSEPTRPYSFDPTLYRGDRAIWFGGRYQVEVRPDSGHFYWKQQAENPDLLRASDDGACILLQTFYEPSVRSQTWYWDFSLPCDHVAPAARHYLREHTKLMTYATPRLVAQTWNDGNVKVGNEQERREFNRALRVLPPGPYRTLQGNGLDKNLVVRMGPPGKQTPFYLVNPGAWPIEVQLKLPGGAKVKDLALGNMLELRSGKLALSLQAYEMRSLAILGKGSVIGVSVEPAASAREDLAKLAKEKAEIYAMVEQMGEAKIAHGLEAVGVLKPVTQVMAEARQIVAAAKTGDNLTVANLTNSYASVKTEQFLKAMNKYLHGVKEQATSYHIDCAALANWTDEQGQVWLADQDWLGGAADWGCTGGNIVDRGNIPVEGAAAGLARLYQTERYGLKSYCFHLKKGSYRVRLHFMESWCNGPGERVFDVAIQGKKVLGQFDIFREAGGKYKALVREFPAEVSGDLLEISFTGGPNTAKIDGIEVIRQTD